MTIANQNLNKFLIRGGAATFVAKVVSTVNMLILTLTLPRLMLPEQLGIYYLTLNFVTIATVVSSLGLFHTIVRQIATHLTLFQPYIISIIIWRLLLLTLFGAITIAGISYLLRDALSNILNIPELSGILGLAFFWIVLRVLQRAFAETFRGYHQILLASIFSGQKIPVGNGLHL